MGDWRPARTSWRAAGALAVLFHAAPAVAATVGDAVAALAAASAGTARLDVAVLALGGLIAPTIREASPRAGDADVAVTRETILRFTAPLEPSTVNATSISVTSAGSNLNPTIHLAPTGDTVTLFYPAPLPAGARIQVAVDGALLRDTAGGRIDANGPGAAGRAASVAFDTLSLAPLADTSVSGRVFASEVSALPGGGSVDTPLEGATITVDGMEATLRTTTDALGNFTLTPVPPGRFFVHIDGRTATNGVPPGAYYPFVGKPWDAVPGRDTNVGDVYLPLVLPGTLQGVSESAPTEVRFAQATLDAAPEDLRDLFAQVRVTVPADSLFADDGTRGGMVGIAPVPSNRLPGRLPLGFDPPLVITVQTDGPTNFDRPVAACFPNLGPRDPDTGAFTTGLAPGEKTALWSFNHDTGVFEVVGGMTVAEDGLLACTDPGVGIQAPGWHFDNPGGGGSGGGGGNGCQNPPDPDMCPAGCGPAGAAGPKKIGCYTVTKKDCDEACKYVNEHKKEVADAWKDFVDSCKGLKGKLSQLQCSIKAIQLLGADYRLSAALDRKVFMCANVGKAADKGEGVQADFDALFDNFTAFLASSGLRAFAEGVADAGAATEDDYAQADAFSTLLDQIDGANGNFSATVASLFAQADALLGEIAETPVDAPGRPIRYAVTTVGGPTVRGETGFDGVARVRLPAASGAAVAFFDAVAWMQGVSAVGEVPANGATVRFPNALLRDATAGDDADGDLLPDLAEHVLGTDATEPDTDGDGLLDGAEVRAGSDPLDGATIAQGILAASATLGAALDVCAADGYIAVVEGTQGASIFNAYVGMNATLLARVDTPGAAAAIACAPRALAVADGAEGLALFDLADPGAASIAHQVDLGGDVRAVAIWRDRVYAGLADGRVFEVGLGSGRVVASLDLGLSVQDLAATNGVLYVLTHEDSVVADAGTLHAIPLSGALAVAETANAPGFQGAGGRRLRLFAGGGVAYAVHSRGYSTFDLSNPLAPAFLAQRADILQAGWRQMVPNGAGLGVGIDGPNSTGERPHFVTSYRTDENDPQTDALDFQIETPGSLDGSGGPNGVALCNGLAYVADAGAGLEVLSYASFSPAGADPTVIVETDIAGDTIVAGAPFLVRATATGAPQVRNVEFLVNDVRAAIDGTFPFEVPLRAPLAGTSFTLRARVADTRGLTAASELVAVNLTPDTTAPQVLATTPADGAFFLTAAAPTEFVATVDERLDPAALAADFRLVDLGADGVLDTADDTTLPTSATFEDDVLAAVLAPGGALAAGRYAAVLGTGVTDLSGNALAAPVSWAIGIFDPGDDADGDCVSAAIELANDLDPTAPDSTDLDGDTLSNCDEVAAGTRVDRADTDGDGLTDGDEIARATDPLDSDSDDDGTSDGGEIEAGCDPLVVETTTLAGRTVRDDAGGAAPKAIEALAGASVRAKGRTTTSAVDGTFSIPDLPVGCTPIPLPLVAEATFEGAKIRAVRVVEGAVTGGTTDLGDVLLGVDTGPLYSGVATDASPGVTAIVSGDFNGDAIDDLAVTSNRVEGFNNVARLTLLRGLGNGVFDEPNPRAAIGVDYVALFTASGHLNGDRIPDLVTTGTGIRVLLAGGDGTFFSLGETDLGGIVTGGSLLVEDVTGDGNGDVVAGGFSDGARVLVVLAGDGGGGFAAPVAFPVAGLTPQAIRAGDLNGDLLADLVVAGTVQGVGGTTNVATLLAGADGSFAVDQTFVLNGGSTVHDARVADLDGDGRLDILAQQLTIGLTALLGNGDGTFQAPLRTAGPRGNRLALADLDDDGALDAVTGGGSVTTTSVALGNADGTFGTAAALPAGVSPIGLALGDFDLDGALDIAVGHASDASVLFGRGDGAFDPTLTPLAPPVSFFSPAYLADLDGDSAADLLTFETSSGGPDAIVALGVGDGGFGAPAAYDAAERFTGFTSVAVADFDGANGPDLAVPSRGADFTTGNLVVIPNAGDGSFPTPEVLDLGDFQPSWAQATDADGDGTTDIAMVGTSVAAQAMGDARRRIAVFTGDGTGNFAAGAPFFPEANAASVLFADLNGDAPTPLPDLIAVCGNLGTCVNGIAVALRNPDLTLGEPTVYAVGAAPLAVAAADLDDDGVLDLAVANSGADTVSVLIGVEDGTFFAAVNHAVGDGPSGVAVFDATGDGMPDVVTIDSGSLSVLAGDGAGGFGLATRFMTGSTAFGWRPVSFADLDGDGLPDLAGSRTGGVDVYLHR